LASGVPSGRALGLPDLARSGARPLKMTKEHEEQTEQSAIHQGGNRCVWCANSSQA
jgi:hypothetical protein